MIDKPDEKLVYNLFLISADHIKASSLRNRLLLKNIILKTYFQTIFQLLWRKGRFLYAGVDSNSTYAYIQRGQGVMRKYTFP